MGKTTCDFAQDMYLYDRWIMFEFGVWVLGFGLSMV